MRKYKIFIPLIFVIFLTGCSAMISLAIDIYSDIETRKDPSSKVPDTNWQESYTAVFETEYALSNALVEGQTSKDYNDFGYDLSKDDLLLYIDALLYSEDTGTSKKVLNYMGYKVNEINISRLADYENAKEILRNGNYKEAYYFFSRTDIFDSKFIAIGMIENDLIQYSVGEKGPAGGYIFYDKGYYSEGWRFIESAPMDLNGRFSFSMSESDKMFSYVGRGKEATDSLISEYRNFKGKEEIIRKGRLILLSAKDCVDFEYGGYSDWYLPSVGEMYYMTVNIPDRGFSRGEGNFYYTSTEPFVWSFEFNEKRVLGNAHMVNAIFVRPCRRF